MSDKQDRDAIIDNLLRRERSSRAVEPGEACLDAEAAAAWIDGGLAPAERERLEAHVADCARCQALVGAIAQSAGAIPSTHEAPSRGWVGWLVPLGAAAAVIVAVIVVPRLLPGADVPEQAKQMASADAPAEPATGDLRERRSEVAEAAGADRADAGRANEIAAAAPPPAIAANRAEPPAAPPPTRAAGAAGRGGARPVDEVAVGGVARQALAARPAEEAVADAAVLEVRSPDPAIRWRVRGSAIERTTDDGVTWVASPAPADTPFVAGAAPSTTTCWLAGRAGLVLLTTDGTSWTRLPFPEPADLVAITATDARTASVTTADGRVFRTTDAGVTWIQNREPSPTNREPRTANREPNPLQET